MAVIVAGFLLPHDPLMTMQPNAPDAAKAAAVRDAFGRIAARLEELRVDTVITVGDDHYRMFSPQCIPQCLIAVGDIDGPLEADLGFARGPIPNNEPLAMHILESGAQDGITWSFAKTLVVDHATAVPYQLCYRPVAGMRVIPIYLNDGVPPFIPNRNAFAIGRSIDRAVSTWRGDERVAVVGTGGCSHWVGSAQTGRINEDFDRRILDLVRRGDIEALIALRDDEVIEQGGNGAVEYKNWICAMGAVQDAVVDVIAYEAVPEWISGLSFAELVRGKETP